MAKIKKTERKEQVNQYIDSINNSLVENDENDSEQYRNEKEFLTKSESAITSLQLIAQAVGLISRKVPGLHAESLDFGTIFLSSLPYDPYEVVLCSSGHVFDGMVGSDLENYPFKEI